MPTCWLIEQLGDRDGDIDDLPRPPAAMWDSEQHMASRRARRRARPSDLREGVVNYSAEELDEEFGVSPGEAWGGDKEDDWEADEAVLRGLTADGNVFEAVMDGERTEGVWRRVVDKNRCASRRVWSTGDSAVVRWTHREQARRRWRVMDPQCMQMVWRVDGFQRA